MACLVTTREIRELAAGTGMSIPECKNLIGMWQEATGASMDEIPDAKTLSAYRDSVRSGMSMEGGASQEGYMTPGARRMAVDDASDAISEEVTSRLNERMEETSNMLETLESSSLTDAQSAQRDELQADMADYTGSNAENGVIDEDGRQDIQNAAQQATGESDSVMDAAWDRTQSRQTPQLNGTPESAIGRLAATLTGSAEAFRELVDRAFKPFAAFYRNGKWVNSWLREMQNPDVRGHIKIESEKPINGRTPSSWTSADALRSDIGRYFSERDHRGMAFAWYPIPGTDKYIRFRRYTSENAAAYKSVIIRHLQALMTTEYNRIREIQNHQGARPDIPGYDQRGTSFLFLPWLNNLELEDGRSLTSVIAQLASEGEPMTLNTAMRSALVRQMEAEFTSEYAKLEQLGLSRGRTRAEMEEFFWNSTLARTQLTQLLAVDPAHFNSSAELEAYLEAQDKEGLSLDSSADWEGMPVAQEERSAFIQSDAAPVGYRSLQSYRDMMIMLGQWTNEMEDAYNARKNGRLSDRDARIIFSPIVHRVNSFHTIQGSDGSMIKLPVYHESVEFPVFAGNGISEALNGLAERMQQEGLDVIRTSPTAMPGGVYVMPYTDMQAEETAVPANPAGSRVQLRDPWQLTNDDISETEPVVTGVINRLSDAIGIERSQFGDPVATTDAQTKTAEVIRSVLAGEDTQGVEANIVTDPTVSADLDVVDGVWDAIVPAFSENISGGTRATVSYSTPSGQHISVPIIIRGVLPLQAGSTIILPQAATARLAGAKTATVRLSEGGTSAKEDIRTKPFTSAADYIRSIAPLRPTPQALWARERKHSQSAERAVAHHAQARQNRENYSDTLAPLFGKSLSKINNHDAVSSLAAAMAADPSLAKVLNITPITADVASLLLGAGLSARQTAIYLNQPIIRDITEAYLDHGRPGDLDLILQDTLSHYAALAGNRAPSSADMNMADFAQADYVSFIESSINGLNKPQAAVQVAIGTRFIGLLKQAMALGRQDSALASVSFEDSLLETVMRVADASLISELGEGSDWYSMEQNESYAFFSHMIDRLTPFFPQVGGNMLCVASEIIDRSPTDGRVTSEMAEDIISDYWSYLMSAPQNGRTVDDDTAWKLNAFPREFESIVESDPAIASNPLIAAIEVKGGAYHPWLSLQDGMDRESMSEAWGDLLDGGAQSHKLATDLFRYAAAAGFREGSLARMAPKEVRQATPGYQAALANALRMARGDAITFDALPETIRQFADQYCLNHLSELSYPVRDASPFMEGDKFAIAATIPVSPANERAMRDIIKRKDIITDRSAGITYTPYTFRDYISVTAETGQTAWYQLDRATSERTGVAMYNRLEPLSANGLSQYAYGWDADQFESQAGESVSVSDAKAYEIDETDALRQTQPREVESSHWNEAWEQMKRDYTDARQMEARFLDSYDNNEGFLDDEGKPICK